MYVPKYLYTSTMVLKYISILDNNHVNVWEILKRL